MLDRDELFAATADSTFLEREHDSDLQAVASRYVDAQALEEIGQLYSDNVVDFYETRRPEASPAELVGVRDAASEMFVLGFVLACHALRRHASAA